jgi:hypothetical protein
MRKMEALADTSPSEFKKMRVLFVNERLRVPNGRKELAIAWADRIGLTYACGNEIPEWWLREH